MTDLHPKSPVSPQPVMPSEPPGWAAAYFDATPDALLALDVVSGSIAGFNPALVRLLGYDAAMLQGAHFSVLLPPQTANVNTPVGRRFPLTGEVAESQIFRHADGSDVPCDVLVVGLRQPPPELAVLHLRDVRSREASHEERLTGEIAALDIAKTEEVVRAVEQYMSHVSHELRTPLAVILSSSSMLERYYPRLSEAKRDEHFSRIQTQVKYLTEFLDNLRFLSRLNAGHIQLRRDPTDMLDLLQEMINGFSGHRQRPYFEVATGGDLASVLIDSGLWRRAMLSVIQNAVIYGPTNAEIRINLVRDGATLEARVADRGPGLPANYLPVIFEVFRRGENNHDQHGGGIGLAIASRSAALMGGTLTYETETGVGTTFTLTVPVE